MENKNLEARGSEVGDMYCYAGVLPFGPCEEPWTVLPIGYRFNAEIVSAAICSAVRWYSRASSVAS